MFSTSSTIEKSNGIASISRRMKLARSAAEFLQFAVYTVFTVAKGTIKGRIKPLLSFSCWNSRLSLCLAFSHLLSQRNNSQAVGYCKGLAQCGDHFLRPKFAFKTTNSSFLQLLQFHHSTFIHIYRLHR